MPTRFLRHRFRLQNRLSRGLLDICYILARQSEWRRIRRVRALFADLADPNNYPMYLHCTYGRDRTGTICYLLEALLGVSDTDLRREYELTTFAYGSVASEDFAAFVTGIDVMEGSTTQEKVENYLLSIGVTPEEIESIRSIFLED